MPRRVHTVTWAVAVAVGLAACAHSSGETTAVRVGDATIGKVAVDHWAVTMQGEDPGSSSPAQTPQRRATAFLISSQWLLGEAAAEGMAVSRQETERALAKRIGSYANGESEFRQFLQLKGQTVADVKLEAELELAAAKIRRVLASKAGDITKAHVAAYYRQHKSSFVNAAKRQVELVYTQSQAAALRIKREAEHGRAISGQPRSEPLVYTNGLHYALTPVVFAATPHMPTGPVRIGNNYFVFEVDQVMPARQQTLAQAEESIEQQLAGERKRTTLDAFLSAWTKRWIPRTDCLAGPLQSICKQYLAAQASNPQAPPGLT